MKILLDTHFLIWALFDSKRLTEKPRSIILDPQNEIYFSDISLWEIEIKRNAKSQSFKLTSEDIFKFCIDAGLLEIPLKKEHIFKLKTLKQKPKALLHKDPFDRMLLAQAEACEIKLLTQDEKLLSYKTDAILKI